MLYNRMTKIAIDPNHKEALTNKQIVISKMRNISSQQPAYIGIQSGTGLNIESRIMSSTKFLTTPSTLSLPPRERGI